MVDDRAELSEDELQVLDNLPDPTNPVEALAYIVKGAKFLNWDIVAKSDDEEVHVVALVLGEHEVVEKWMLAANDDQENDNT